MAGRPTRWKEYDDVRTVYVKVDGAQDGEQQVKRVRVPGWVQVEEGHEMAVGRAMDDVKTGRLTARLDSLRSQMAERGGRMRTARARNTRQRKKMMEDLGGVDPRELARIICSRE